MEETKTIQLVNEASFWLKLNSVISAQGYLVFLLGLVSTFFLLFSRKTFGLSAFFFS